MSVLDEVFGSLESMSQLQLLMAFVACGGYAFAQGNLLPSKGRRAAWLTSCAAAIGFAIESTDWTHAAMLGGFAIVGMGSFIASVWVTSRALGFEQAAPRAEADTAAADLPIASTVTVTDPVRTARPGDPAPSV